MSVKHYDPHRPLSDCLTAAGFGHRRNERTESSGKRTVFRLDTGEEVGRFDALEAAEWLQALDAQMLLAAD